MTTRLSWTTAKVDERGLSTTCSQCPNKAVWYGKGCTAYCDTCWPGERREVRRETPVANEQLVSND